MNGNQSLTLADALKSLSEDVQAENGLIAGRVIWYVTSQAFLLTAYATSWNAGFGWPMFFHASLVANRTNHAGVVVGPRIHALVRITPFVLPIGFSALWLYAYFFAPHAAG